MEEKVPVPEARIRWLPADEEAAQGTGATATYRRPQPANDSDNLSIRSLRDKSRRGSVDPANTLPIQYRTV